MYFAKLRKVYRRSCTLFCLYDRVALPKGTNQNLSMRSLQIQGYHTTRDRQSTLRFEKSISAV
jgi:hypothetical protein